MSEFGGVNALYKSGLHRLRDAEELLQAPTLLPQERGARERHLTGAMYLAGYGIECILKVYILRQRNAQTLMEVQNHLREQGRETKDIQSAAGHDLLYLFSLTDLDERTDPLRRRQIGICFKWKSTWRYDPRIADRAEADRFVQAARDIVSWIDRQI